MMRYIIIPIVVLVGIISTGLSQASYRETFEKEFMLSPWYIATGEISACIQCHTSDDMGPEMHEITQQWKEGFHAKHNVSCHDCHGGAPEDASMAMMHQRGFKGTPKDKDIPEFCGTCHIAILNNYLNSGHGKTFIETGEGDMKEEVTKLYKISKVLRDKRYSGGSINFERDEVKFHLAEDGTPTGVYFKR